MISKTPLCYTIGYGNRTLEEFISLLQINKITHLIDIRRYPNSWMEHFDKELLQRILPKNRISYMHCTGVGGMRESAYYEYMETEEFNHSFSRLVDLIMEVNGTDGYPVLMCAEKSPKNCHRRYLAQNLERSGIKIIHLTEPGQTDFSSFS
ncbi:MAG: DUF488 domain-containing protein [Methanomethylovorans sp.]|uniref:DUF488 domain-containing protein n=1 Tax=Methanomethylovorans sp. TaxID=2758717 RepID=UPI002630EDF6|nr:DUF488 domain-containing protein [Methanomethylovorans sp.]